MCVALEIKCARHGKLNIPSQTPGGGAGLHRALEKLLADVAFLLNNRLEMDAKQTFLPHPHSLLESHLMLTSFQYVV